MKPKFIIGIDLGGTNLKIALLNSRYRIIQRKILSTQNFNKKEYLISVIVNSINGIIEDSMLKKADILGVGLGLPGPIDQVRGLVHFFPNIPGWSNVKLRSILKQRIGLPVFLDNDAKLMALAEYRLGQAAGFRNVVCLTLGTGVGAGLIISGKLYRGADNAAGEIGHVPINEFGPLCNCGAIACLESYIGNSRILRQARRQFGRHVSLERLAELAKKQNKKALNIWLRVAGRLGIALAGAVNLLNLDAIIIGGGVANVGKVLFDKVREAIEERSMYVQARRVKVLRAKLGPDAGMIGAAIFVRESLLKDISA